MRRRPGERMERAGERTRKVGAAAEKTGAAAEKAGAATEKAGAATAKAGKAVRTGGQAATKAGLATSKVGVGIPVAAAGAAATGAGAAGEAGGRGAQAAGKATKAGGRGVKQAGRGVKNFGGQLRDAGRQRQQAGKLFQQPLKRARRVAGKGVKVGATTGKGMAFAFNPVFAAVLVPVILLPLVVALFAGGSSGITSALPDDVVHEHMSSDQLQAYQAAGDQALVPWPLLAGIAHAASEHGTRDPYSSGPVQGPIGPADGDVGGYGPLLMHPELVAASGVDPHDEAAAAQAMSQRLSEFAQGYVDGLGELGEQLQGPLAQYAMFNAEFIPDAVAGLEDEGSQWYEHVALWHEVLTEIPDLVQVPYDGACMTDPNDGYSLPQQVHLVFTCEASRAQSLQVVDPAGGEVLEGYAAVRALVEEAVGVSWLFSGWDTEECNPGRVEGGVLPVPPGERIYEEDPETGEQVWTGEYTYDRCDRLDAMRAAAELVVGRASVDVDDRPGNEWERAAYGWLALPDTLGARADADGQPGWANRFLNDGPVASASSRQASESCADATYEFADAAFSDPHLLPGGFAYMVITDDPQPSEGAPERWFDHLSGREHPAWTGLVGECGQPAVSDGVADAGWASTVRQEFRRQTSMGRSLPDGQVRQRVKGFLVFLDYSIAGGHRLEAEWGRSSAVPRLSNPQVDLKVPNWQRPGQAQFADQALRAALAYIGEDCGQFATSVGFGQPAAGGGAQAGAGARPDLAVQAAYDVGLRGDTLVLAVAIARAESGWVPDANNAGMNTNGTVDYGLWQINTVHNPPVPDIYDPDVNAGFMWEVSSGGTRWTPWVVYNTGAYQQYLGAARDAVDEHLGSAAWSAPPEGGGPAGPLPSAGTQFTASSGLCGPDAGTGDYTVNAGGSAGAWGGFSNGQIPTELLCNVRTGMPSTPSDARGMLLECNAARAFAAMDAAYEAHFGRRIPSISAYRDLPGQRATAIANCGSVTSRNCSPATARPGHSNHGWALAVDMTDPSCSTNNGCGFNTAHFAWFQQNAHRFGYFHPDWARQGRPNAEYWHWEFPAPA